MSMHGAMFSRDMGISNSGVLKMTGSLVVGPVLAWLFLRVIERVQHVATAIILQFVSTPKSNVRPFRRPAKPLSPCEPR